MGNLKTPMGNKKKKEAGCPKGKLERTLMSNTALFKLNVTTMMIFDPQRYFFHKNSKIKINISI